ncbi:MAG TPA: DEAD/DEAH box helicase [Pseudomonas sp.]
MISWYEESKANISNPEFNQWDDFLLSLVTEYNRHKQQHLIQDIVIRSLERKGEMENSFILDHLLGELGLYPYVGNVDNTSKDLFRRSIFTTPQDENKIFHIRQAEVFHRIINGENIILSAPTSFGKSLIIEALIATREFTNIVVVVPTIALMDELKKKLYKYSNTYKIITQVTQKSDQYNIYILTQERVLEHIDLGIVDFFIIDEFYKLAPTTKLDERCDRLNLAFKKLYAKCKRFYMLGPRINGLAAGIEDELRCTFLKFDYYATVSTNEFFYPIVSKGRDADKDLERDTILLAILKSIGNNEQTVIYCKSPKRASSLMVKLLDSGLLNQKIRNEDFSIWLGENFHHDWSLVEGLKHGIAYHHSQLPRAVASLIVDYFNSSDINIIICTSTLIEGVNTNAKNIIIYDDCITRRTKLDMFTFNNIAGRSGRMFEHFVGNVYILGEKPQNELPFIDMPIVTQSENASDSLLLHMGAEVSEPNKEKIKGYYEQEAIPISLILKHQGIHPSKLIEFANALIDKCNAWNGLMRWDGIYPTNPQLMHLSKILFKYFNVSSMGGGAVRSDTQLHKKIIDVINKVDDKILIIRDQKFWVSRSSDYNIDDAIQAVFNFKKNLINYNLPKIIYAISDIQELIFKRFSYPFGDYKSFASTLENFYFPPAVNSLEEFGIPIQITKKILANHNFDDMNVDQYIIKLKAISMKNLTYLTEFEARILKHALSYT